MAVPVLKSCLLIAITFYEDGAGKPLGPAPGYRVRDLYSVTPLLASDIVDRLFRRRRQVLVPFWFAQKMGMNVLGLARKTDKKLNVVFCGLNAMYLTILFFPKFVCF